MPALVERLKKLKCWLKIAPCRTFFNGDFYGDFHTFFAFFFYFPIKNKLFSDWTGTVIHSHIKFSFRNTKIPAPRSTFGWWIGYFSKGNKVYYLDIKYTGDHIFVTGLLIFFKIKNFCRNLEVLLQVTSTHHTGRLWNLQALIVLQLWGADINVFFCKFTSLVLAS